MLALRDHARGIDYQRLMPDLPTEIAIPGIEVHVTLTVSPILASQLDSQRRPLPVGPTSGTHSDPEAH